MAEVSQKEGWKIEELHTEEGRLDEVFRSITWSETAEEQAKAAQSGPQEVQQ